MAPIVHDALPAPVMPAHYRPELFAPERYFPTAAISREIYALCFEDFTLGELRHVLATRKRRLAPGMDGITYQMVRNLDESQLPQLLEAYNSVWRTDVLSETWRVAVAMPLLKKGKPSPQPGSYRPVSLTSAAGKVDL